VPRTEDQMSTEQEQVQVVPVEPFIPKLIVWTVAENTLCYFLWVWMLKNAEKNEENKNGSEKQQERVQD